MPTIWADVSKWQKVVADDTYPHHWLSFRCCDGTYIDPLFSANHAWAHYAAKTGRLVGYTAYCVYRPGVDVLAILQQQIPTPDKYLTVMVDVESWGGQITGDHSTEIAALCNSVGVWLGDRRRVLAYGNQNDLANLFPHRPSWLRLVVASYGTQRPDVPGMVAWQYTDGGNRWPSPPGLPVSSPPFGNCDHNIAPDYTPRQFAALLGVGRPAPTPPTPVPTPVPAARRHPLWAIEHIYKPQIARLRARLARLSRRHK